MASDLPLAQRPAPATMPARMPVLLSFLAGYVDSCTFLALFGLFVAQVTGSFVLAGTLFVTHQHGAVIKILAIPAFFVAGVATTIIVRRMPWMLRISGEPRCSPWSCAKVAGMTTESFPKRLRYVAAESFPLVTTLA